MLDPVAIPPGDAVLAVLPRLRAALAGGVPLVPYAAGSPPPTLPTRGATELPADLALCVGTSGSTGAAKLAMLTAGALTASATATLDALGGPGQWLLPMPAHHVAGLQVLVRSVVAGTTPVVLDLSEGFTVTAFADATEELSGERRYTALVPTQLNRLVADPLGRRALAAYDGVLVGGAGTPPRLLGRAREAGARVVTTYGMSETAGGCVYDGVPLRCTRVRLDEGRIVLGGATVAHGYLGRPDLTAAAFSTDVAGVRWFRTDDAGHLDTHGRWHVDGRVDDLINTGGLKVAPRVVEEALTTHLPEVAEAVVVGVPNPDWGEAVGAAVVVTGSPPSLADVRSALRGHVPDHARPRVLLVLDTIPLRGPGKPDRRAVASALSDREPTG